MQRTSQIERLYYWLKPYVPWRARIAARRWRAQRRREAFADCWPILPSSATPPAGWPGWPGGKRFAFVLTHDVESQKGLDRCLQLSEFETKLGFRSSFNFIPEGKYRVPATLRQHLVQTGFEVGVHDLRHDGFLYRSRESFSNAARQINLYVRDWKADGFRSGFMLHQLDWFEDLEVLYDASTFDTDPFEPQPDGVGTIFPFWCPTGTGGIGYVELPYTLAQDFSLFVILQEKTIDIWKRKIDWIAAQGGMALLIIHPDYLNFSNSWEHPDEFPSALYQELLEYVNTRYGNDCWKALPRDVARFIKQHKSVLSRTNDILPIEGLSDSNLETERTNADNPSRTGENFTTRERNADACEPVQATLPTPPPPR